MACRTLDGDWYPVIWLILVIFLKVPWSVGSACWATLRFGFPTIITGLAYFLEHFTYFGPVFDLYILLLLYLYPVLIVKFSIKKKEWKNWHFMPNLGYHNFANTRLIIILLTTLVFLIAENNYYEFQEKWFGPSSGSRNFVIRPLNIMKNDVLFNC